MDVHRYTPAGRIDKTHGLSPRQADDIYQSLVSMVRVPYERYYRITLVDPIAGGRIVRDTDHEIFGRSTMIPRVRYNPNDVSRLG